MLEHFEIGEELHRGSRSTVFRIRRRDGSGTAIVKLSTRPVPRLKDVHRLRREYELGRRFDAPSLVRYQEIHSFRGGLAITQEDFAARAVDPANDTSNETVWAIAVAVAGALQVLHEAGYVHCDVAPGNILVNPATGVVKLGDLGSARQCGRVHAIESTLLYVAPELTGRLHCPIDGRADLYGLGATLFHVACGRPPFDETDPVALVHSHVAVRPPSIRHLRPDLDADLAELIDAMLAKDPDGRPPAAADVLERLHAGARHGSVAPNERSVAWALDDRRFVGRTDELGWLRDHVEAAADRGGVVVVAGSAGCGKSALATEFRRQVTGDGACVLWGKHEVGRADIPYDGLKKALEPFVASLLTLDEPALARWRSRLLETLGPLAAALHDVLADLRLVTGPMPPLPVLTGVQHRTRLVMAVRLFCRAIADERGPLVIVLDDMQWADEGTCELLAALPASKGLKGCALVLLVRPDELGDGHPFVRTRSQWRARRIPYDDLHLGPLAADDVVELVTSALLRCNADDVRSFAEKVTERSGGNALYVRELLTMARQRGLFSSVAAVVVAGERFIDHLDCPTGMLDFLVARIRTASAAAQAVLGPAALVGTTFTTATLVGLLGDETLVETGVRDCRTEGFFVAADDGHRFAHDRLLEASLTLVPPEDRRRLHLAVGRLLFDEHRRRGGSADRLPVLLHHFADCRAAIVNEGERRNIAEACLAAAQHARNTGAVTDAHRLFALGCEYIDDGDWNDDRRVAFDVHLGLAETEHALRRFGDAEASMQRLAGRVRTRLERIRLLRVRASCLACQQRMREAVEFVREGLAAFDRCLPDDPDAVEAETCATFEAIAANLTAEDGRWVGRLPPISDPALAALLDMLQEALPALLYYDRSLLALMILQATRLTIDHGVCPATPPLLAATGLVLSWRFERHGAGLALFEAADELDRNSFDNVNRPQLAVFMVHVAHFRRSLRSLTSRLVDDIDACRMTGSLVYFGFSVTNLLVLSVLQGLPLEQLIELERQYAPAVRELVNPYFDQICRCQRLVAEVLTGIVNTDELGGLLDDHVRNGVAAVPDVSRSMAQLHLWFACERIFVVLGERSAALTCSDRVGTVVEGAISFAMAADHCYLRAVVLADGLLAGIIRGAARSAARSELATRVDRLTRWAGECPANYEHKAALARGLVAWIDGDEAGAAVHLSQAVDSANRHDFLHNEALACERAAAFHGERGRAAIAEMYLLRAVEAYRRWGCTVKVERLRTDHPWLAMTGGWQAPDERVSTATISAEGLDLAAIARAARAISSEVDTTALRARLVQLAAEVSGASRAFLYEGGDEQPCLVARYEAHPADSAHAERLDDEVVPVVRYVRRTGREVVRGRAGTTAFDADDGQRAKAFVCMPVVTSGEVSCVLYLENDHLETAFPHHVHEPIRILAAQAAISLTTARLVGRLETATTELARTNVELERRVLERTRELTESNANLEAFTHSVSHDIRNPLFALSIHCQTLRDRLGRLQISDVDPVLERIEQTITHLDDLTKSLLGMATAVRPHVIREDVDLAIVARSVVDELRLTEPERCFALELPTTLVCRCDRQLVHVLLSNLIGNAWKYTGPAVDPRIEFGALGLPSDGTFFVRDNGIGLDPSLADDLFRPFRRLHNSSAIPGTGIGLATARRIVEHHGGRIWCSGSPGAGATFCFTLDERGAPAFSTETSRPAASSAT